MLKQPQASIIPLTSPKKIIYSKIFFQTLLNQIEKIEEQDEKKERRRKAVKTF